MSRPRKQNRTGSRTVGIQGKHGKLYMLLKTPVMENGIKKYKTEWIPTGLDDRPENVHKASEMR